MQILIPVDFSEASARAFRFALALNRFFLAKIQVLHLFDIPITAGDESDVYLKNYEAYRKSYEDDLWDFIKRNGNGVQQDIQVYASAGGHYQGIAEFSRSHHADLIIVGHKGKSKLAKWVFGSVSRHLLTNPPVPVLSVPENLPEKTEEGIQHILLASDLSSEIPRGQASFLLDFAHTLKASIEILHIRIEGELPVMQEEHIRDTMAGQFKTSVMEKQTGKDEDIAHALSRHIKEKDFDLLAVMPHYHTWLDRMLIGSETRDISNLIDTPILAIPDKK